MMCSCLHPLSWSSQADVVPQYSEYSHGHLYNSSSGLDQPYYWFVLIQFDGEIHKMSWLSRISHINPYQIRMDLYGFNDL